MRWIFVVGMPLLGLSGVSIYFFLGKHDEMVSLGNNIRKVKHPGALTSLIHCGRVSTGDHQFAVPDAHVPEEVVMFPGHLVKLFEIQVAIVVGVGGFQKILHEAFR